MPNNKTHSEMLENNPEQAKDAQTTKPSLSKISSSRPHAKNILQLSAIEAKSFFLKNDSYCNFGLPDYFSFEKILNDVDAILSTNDLKKFHTCQPRNLDGINYKVLNNKDGKYAWRPMQLIHPAIYVSLVNVLTNEDHWKLIAARFSKFSENPRIECISLPIVSTSNKTDKAQQVLNWWHSVEQKSIELALDYDHIIQTDIADCYSSIYTHTVPWALHGKEFSKKNRSVSVIGNQLDWHLQDMSNGQTNGIPQGSTLMDFVAEMVLGYADMMLTSKIGEDVSDYHIIRYRDDYRIFVNNPQDGEKIAKCLTEVLIDLNLKLNAEKTKISNEVINSSIKSDKLFWARQKNADENLQRHLLIIQHLAESHPNSGSLVVALQDYYDTLLKAKKVNTNVIPLISIIVDIAFKNPRTYPLASAILSLLIKRITPDNQKEVLINKILRKFEKIPNTGHLKIWLQRITLGYKSNYQFDEPLCQLVDNDKIQIWNNSWLDNSLQNQLDASKAINKKKLLYLPEIITEREISLFPRPYHS